MHVLFSELFTLKCIPWSFLSLSLSFLGLPGDPVTLDFPPLESSSDLLPHRALCSNCSRVGATPSFSKILALTRNIITSKGDSMKGKSFLILFPSNLNLKQSFPIKLEIHLISAIYINMWHKQRKLTYFDYLYSTAANWQVCWRLYHCRTSGAQSTSIKNNHESITSMVS